MARSILAIAREAAERKNTAPPPSTLFGTNERVARILRIAIKDSMRDIMRRAAHSGLSDLYSTWVMVLQPGRYAYPLPLDFLRMIVNTEHRGGWPMGLVGPATPQAWSAWISGGGTVTAPMGWRISNGALFIDPTPAKQEIVTIDYISRYLVVSPIVAGDYDASTPPDAIPPTVPRDGFIDGDASEVIYDGTGTGFSYGTAPGWNAAVWTANLSDILKRINPLASNAPAPEVRREEFTTDADMPAFEDDYVLSLGMTFRLRRALGLAYAEEAAEYEEELDMKLASDAGGGARPFKIGGDHSTCDVLPLGGSKWMVS